MNWLPKNGETGRGGLCQHDTQKGINKSGGTIGQKSGRLQANEPASKLRILFDERSKHWRAVRARKFSTYKTETKKQQAALLHATLVRRVRRVRRLRRVRSVC